MPSMAERISEVPEATASGIQEILVLQNISKRFPGVDALIDVDFDLRRGEVHVLFGENGAGKSTLISLVSGAETPTSGTMRLNGEETSFRSVHEARQHGISAVFQEFSLVPQLTVEENLFLGEEVTQGLFLDKAEIHRRAGDAMNNRHRHGDGRLVDREMRRERPHARSRAGGW